MNSWKEYKNRINIKRYRLRKYKLQMKEINRIRKKHRKILDKKVLMNLHTQVATDEKLGNTECLWNLVA